MPAVLTAEKIAPNAVRYEWSGTAPFDIWRDGIKVLDQTELTEYVAQNTDGTTNPLPAIEVRDDDDTGAAQSQRHSPRIRFQWRGQADAAVYLVEQYEDTVWQSRGAIVENGSGYYSFETLAHSDGATVQYRVVPQDENGYQGEPMPFTFSVVCNPAPPAVIYSYDASTGLSVAAP